MSTVQNCAHRHTFDYRFCAGSLSSAPHHCFGAKIEHKTAATAEEVHRAGDLGPLLLAALGVREHGTTATPAEAADRKVRAFTLFTTAYDQVRRAVTYLRWNEGDGDSLAPSLYKGRGGSRNAGGEKGEGSGDVEPEEQAPGSGGDGEKKGGQ